jgi:hypothetical protein
VPTTEPEFKARPTTFEIVANLKTNDLPIADRL